MNDILATGVLVTPDTTYQLTLLRDALVYQPCTLFKGTRLYKHMMYTAVDAETPPQSVNMAHTTPQALCLRGVWSLPELRKVLPVKVEHAHILTPMDIALESAGAS